MLKQLRADDCCSDSSITARKPRGARTITFKCSDAVAAENVEKEIAKKV